MGGCMAVAAPLASRVLQQWFCGVACCTALQGDKGACNSGCLWSSWSCVVCFSCVDGQLARHAIGPMFQCHVTSRAPAAALCSRALMLLPSCVSLDALHFPSTACGTQPPNYQPGAHPSGPRPHARCAPSPNRPAHCARSHASMSSTSTTLCNNLPLIMVALMLMP